jgi:restriction endonuclease Mrr
MELNIKTVAFWCIDHQWSNTNPCNLKDYLDSVLTNRCNYSIEERQEIVDENYIKLADEIENMLDRKRNDGTNINIKLEYNGDVIFITNNQQARTRILTDLKNLDSEKFEHLCSEILEKLGADKKGVTGGKQDGGIDFWGYGLDLTHQLGPTTKGGKMFIVGQAKRYTESIVKESDLRKFIGGALLSKHKISKDQNINVGLLQPTIYAYFTTSIFNKDSIEFANNMGIWYLDGLSLSHLIEELEINLSKFS